MTHPLTGKKQSPEHIAKRLASYPDVRKPQDMGKKLLKKINKTTAGCWQWTGSVFKKDYGNYGQIRVGKRGQDKLLRAHRVSYEYFVGEIPTGLELDHLCHNTLCVNPDHLEAVTHSENMKRRKDSNLPSCKHGHEYTAATTYINVKGYRRCRTCRNISSMKSSKKVDIT